MNYRLGITSFCFAVLLAIASCAKAEPEDSTKLEKMAFDAWMRKYVLDEGIRAVEQSNGMWVEFIEDGDQTIDASRDTIVWLMLDYTSTDIQNNVFATRDSIQALRQGTYTPHTYYVPHYLPCHTEVNYGMTSGRYYALRSDLSKPDGSTMKLSKGSRVRLYMPSYMAYGTNGYTDDQGYGGQFELEKTQKIVIEDLTVKEVVKNPIGREENLVNEHALQRWGLAETDTVATMFYVDTLNFVPRAELLARFPNKPFIDDYKLTADSTARIWFVGRFLPSAEYPDGFIFDTNIESVWEGFYNRRKADNYGVDSKAHSVFSYKAADEEDSSQRKYIPAYYHAIPKLRKGQWSRIVFTSAYGYGVTGQSKALKDRQAEVASWMSYYYSSSMYNNMYGNSYYGNYYDNYYGGSFYNYSTSLYSEEEDEQDVMTEIQPYTPLVFEIYIESYDGE